MLEIGVLGVHFIPLLAVSLSLCVRGGISVLEPEGEDSLRRVPEYSQARVGRGCIGLDVSGAVFPRVEAEENCMREEIDLEVGVALLLALGRALVREVCGAVQGRRVVESGDGGEVRLPHFM